MTVWQTCKGAVWLACLRWMMRSTCALFQMDKGFEITVSGYISSSDHIDQRSLFGCRMESYWSMLVCLQTLMQQKLKQQFR